MCLRTVQNWVRFGCKCLTSVVGCFRFHSYRERETNWEVSWDQLKMRYCFVHTKPACWLCRIFGSDISCCVPLCVCLLPVIPWKAVVWSSQYSEHRSVQLMTIIRLSNTMIWLNIVKEFFISILLMAIVKLSNTMIWFSVIQKKKLLEACYKRLFIWNHLLTANTCTCVMCT